MSESSVAELISGARAARTLTRQQLAEATGYSVVMIAKIESGERLPDGRRIPILASALGIDADELRRAAGRSDGRRSSAPKIVDAMKLARQNSERVTRLKARAEQLTAEAEQVAGDLDAKVGEFDRNVVGEFAGLLSRLTDLPEEVFAPSVVEDHQSMPEFSDALRSVQSKTSKTIHALVVAGLLGGGAGTTVGRPGGSDTYVTVASVARTATGTAISELSGSDAAWTMFASSGRLAATGMTLASGTRSLAGPVVAGAAAFVAAVALAASGGRVLDRQISIQNQIEDAEKAFEVNSSVVRRFIRRASSINEILTVSLIAVRGHKRTIEGALREPGEVAWADLDRATQTLMHRVAEIILACLTVISLPIGLEEAQAVSAESLKVEVTEDGAVLPPKRELDAGPELENEYIDYVIQEVLAQVAR